MIKNIEQLDENELSYVKNSLEKYLTMQSDDEVLIGEYIKRINKQIKQNDKDIRRLDRKISYLETHENDDLVKVIGSLISALSFLGYITFNDANNFVVPFVCASGGVGMSYLINEIVNMIKDKERKNVYTDMDLIDSAKKDNETLEDIKEELLECADYHKALRRFTNK